MIVVVVIFVTVIYVGMTERNTAEQKTLQAQLANPMSPNYEAMASAASTLISGKLNGTYHFSNTQLAEYYLDGASAYYNLKQYAEAMAYYEAAPKYDATLATAALEGEAFTGYAAGQRTQLIPILTKLEAASENVHNPMAPTPAQYQEDIMDIQHNQPAENL